MAFQFTQATKFQARGRIALIGPSGSGKTFSALRIAQGIGGRIAVIDTEHGSASKYAGHPGLPAFDRLNLDTFGPKVYVEAILAAESAEYDVVIVDSLSHAWAGKGGALEQVEAAKGGDAGRFGGWRTVTPQHNALVDAIVGCRCHLIGTMRSKQEFALDKGSDGKVVVTKLGMAPVQRDGMEYEFDVVGDLSMNHTLAISKTRCPGLDGQVIQYPGEELGRTILAWLSDGAVKPEPVQAEEFLRDHPPAKGIGTEGANRVRVACRAAVADGLTPLAVKAESARAVKSWGQPEAWTPEQEAQFMAELGRLVTDAAMFTDAPPTEEPAEPAADSA